MTSPSTRKAPPPWFARSALCLLGLFLLLLPSAFWSEAHEPFVVGKRAVLLGLALPGLALLLLGQAKSAHPLAWVRGLTIAIVAIFLLHSGVAADAPDALGHLLPYLLIALSPLLAMEIGYGFASGPSGARRGILLLALSAVPVLVLGSLRRFAPDAIPWLTEHLLDRADVAFSSTLGNSNELGEFAAPLALLAPAAVVRRKSLALLLCVPPMALTLLSSSRAAALALFAGGVIALVLHLVSGKRDSAGLRPGAALAGLLFLAATLAVAIPSTRARLTTVFDAEHPTNVVRLGLLKSGIALGNAHIPFGVGSGRFSSQAPPYRSDDEWVLSGLHSQMEDPHNEWVWTYAENGIVGLLAWGLLLLFALRQIARALRSEDAEHRRLAPWIGGAFAAFLVLTLLRSPLHHPCGALAPFLAIGTLLTPPLSTGPASRSRVALLATLPLLAVALVLELHDDQVLHQARRQHILGSEAIREGASGIPQIRENLAGSTASIRRLLAVPWLSHERAYRAALLTQDLVQVRKALESPAMRSVIDARGWPPPAEWLPSDHDFLGLLDRALEIQPANFATRLLKADMLLQWTRATPFDAQQEHYRAVADQVLAEGIRLQPGVYPLLALRARVLSEAGDSRTARDLLERAGDTLFSDGRSRLLGELALTLGNDPSTFGTYLDLNLESSEFTSPAPLSAEDVSEPLHGDARLHQALLHLGRHPTSQEALKVIADRAFDLSRGEQPELVEWANRSVARQRVLIHLEEGEEAPEGRSRVVMALRRDPAFLDAHYLLARLAAREGREDQVAESISALLLRGVLAVDLERRIRTEPTLPEEARRMLLTALLQPR